MKAFFKKLKNRFPDALLLHGPACRYCMESGIGCCTCPDEPCRYPEMWTYPPEAVGIDITGTMENAGIPFDVTMKSSVTRVGIACFPCPVDLPRLVDEFAQREGYNHDKNAMV
ncbi:hypothetical protein GF325_08030 [Candidatus Bathyarchaeota archaeon]|nr:hypothetical protein [Candidatus Bathyarchaeota archaeon]